jgi:phosphate transport system protein
MALLKRTSKGFNTDLRSLAGLVAEMGGCAERQLAEAIEALTRRDNEGARANVAADAVIDVMQQTIEQRAMDIILTRRPVAEDLRQVVGIVRIANELERIGDLAKNISKRIIAIKSGHSSPIVARVHPYGDFDDDALARCAGQLRAARCR